ncbi:polysaccharide biosynthesis protein [Treponema sp.]|uniref:polysaccharide biosynthesis protein n=1 Tax=Treponema sp. TaxID=166 RepID=UPI003F00EBED
MNKIEGRLYIIGAGFAGQMIASDIAKKKVFGTVSAFLDDDKNLIGTKIDGIPVLGPLDSIADALRVDSSDQAIIAIPTAPVERIRKIYDALKKCGFTQIKILPSISQIIDEKAHIIQARDINPLDILGRTPVTIPLAKSLAYLKGKRVLITGAGGSIGSELARQLLSGGAERLYLFGHGENSIVNIYRELHLLQDEGIGQKASVVPIIGDMKDREYVKYIISHTHADVIFHCAAYKHVPMMEENSIAAIENNVFGTKNLLDAALEAGTEKFVLISTDKAVEPVSVYGASKLLCEKLVIQAAESASKNQSFMFVRFGNVLGSRGSILPIFMEQIQNGGPVTVTDPKMERYFMTIPEACSLVLQTGGVGANGASYLLDMGEPIKIVELAKQVITFSGFTPDKEIKIQFIGARKGERLEEPLWLKEEKPEMTEYKKILKLTNIPLKNFSLDKLLKSLEPICALTQGKEQLYRNSNELKSILRKAIPSLDKFYMDQEQLSGEKDREQNYKAVL